MIRPSASAASSPSELQIQTQKERQVEGWLPEDRTASLVPRTQQGILGGGGLPKHISLHLCRVDQGCHHPHKKSRHLFDSLADIPEKVISGNPSKFNNKTRLNIA